jgi:hypothetical protein
MTHRTRTLALAAIVALASIQALAQPACSPPEGTLGFSRFGEPQRCKDGTAVPCTGMMLGDGGVWLHCQVKPEPPGCPDKTEHETWTDARTGLTCTSRPPGAITGMPTMLQARKHRQSMWLWDDFSRDRIGGYRAVCNAGTWEASGSYCVRR